jgi:FAD:protein FMN transferase
MTPATAAKLRHVFTAFGGSRCEVIACDTTEEDISAAVTDTYAFEQQLTRFDTRSELSRFNAAAGAPVPVSPLLAELLRVSLDAYALSDGLVNAACLPALVAAGYDRTITEVQRRSNPQIKAVPTIQVPALPEVLEVGNGWARIAAGCAIDLGGIGKGWLADTLCDRFDNAAINLGGDIRTRGSGPDGTGWSVALCNGRVVTVRDAGIATSGTTGRRWPGGHHLIDPRTGLPAQTDITAISVIADTALRAEILAKGACLLGSGAASSWLKQRDAAGWKFVRAEAERNRGIIPVTTEQGQEIIRAAAHLGATERARQSACVNEGADKLSLGTDDLLAVATGDA